MRRVALVVGTRGAPVVLWFAEAVWMVFALAHVLQDQSRSMWTRAVMCKGLSQSCGEQGLLTGTARLFGDPKAGENLNVWRKVRGWDTFRETGLTML